MEVDLSVQYGGLVAVVDLRRVDDDRVPVALGDDVELVADGRAVATSSDAHTVFSADHRHHHIMDPHTGYSPTHWSSVSVLAPSCTLADALTKVFFTLPREQVQPVAQRWKVDVVLQDKAGHWTSTL